MSEPNGAIRNEVNSRQNSEYGLMLLRAVHAAHGRVRAVNRSRCVVSLALAGLALAFSIAGVVAPWLAGAGAAWALADLLLVRLVCRSAIVRAALFQEEFDLWLYTDMSWDETLGDRPSTDTIKEWARRWRGGDGQLVDWYPDVRGMVPALATLSCQRVNVAWDLRLRRRFGRSLVAAVVSWCLVGIGISLIAGWTAADLVLRWFAPSSGALIHAGELAWQQHDLALRKGRILAVIDRHVAGAGAAPSAAKARELDRLARAVQMRLTELRMRIGRVPAIFYTRYYRTDNDDIVAVVAHLKASLEAVPAPDR